MLEAPLILLSVKTQRIRTGNPRLNWCYVCGTVTLILLSTIALPSFTASQTLMQ